MRHVYPILATLTLVGAALLPAAPATASVPSPLTSVTSQCIVSTFTGSQILHVVVTDLMGNPIASSAVVVDLSACSTAEFCSPPCTGCTYYPALKAVRLITGSNGVADFDLRVAGYCPGATVRVYADGVLIAQRALMSADHDRTGAVTAADVAYVHGQLGSVDPSVDFDCSGVVDAGDEAFALSQQGTYCDAPTPALPRSWGQLKVRYR